MAAGEIATSFQLIQEFEYICFEVEQVIHLSKTHNTGKKFRLGYFQEFWDYTTPNPPPTPTPLS